MLIIWENKIVCCDNWSFENIHNSGPSGDTKKGSLLLRGYMSCQNRRSRRVKRVRRIKTRKARRLPKSHSRRPSKSHVDNCLARMAIVQGNGIYYYQMIINKEKQRGCPLLAANRYTHIYISYICVYILFICCSVFKNFGLR